MFNARASARCRLREALPICVPEKASRATPADMRQNDAAQTRVCDAILDINQSPPLPRLSARHKTAGENRHARDRILPRATQH